MDLRHYETYGLLKIESGRSRPTMPADHMQSAVLTRTLGSRTLQLHILETSASVDNHKTKP